MIASGQAWRIWNSEKQRYDYVYCFGDVHLQHPINEAQLTALVSTIGRSGNKDEILVLAEDSFFTCISDTAIVKAYYENAKKVASGQKAVTAMNSLVACCLQHGVDAVNIDIRWSHQVTLALLIVRTQSRDLAHAQTSTELLCGQQAPEIFASASTIDDALRNFYTYHGLTISFVVADICKAIERMKTYDDGFVLNAYYAKIVHTVLERMKILFGNQSLESLQYNNQTIFDYYCSLPVEQQKDFITRYALFNAELIDAYALHSMHNARDKQKIFIVMGGAHIASMQHILERMGYELLASYGAQFLTFEQAWKRDKVKKYHSLDARLFDTVVQTTKPYWLHRIKAICNKIVTYVDFSS